MRNNLELDGFYARYAIPLQLHWQHRNTAAATQRLTGTVSPRPWINYASVSEPHCIDVVTPAHHHILPELIAYWQAQPARAPDLLILADRSDLSKIVRHRQTLPAIMTSEFASHDLIRFLSYELASSLPTNISEHGVFMNINGLGVLLRGKDGIGKSELALELIRRGHRLIVDDAPLFYRSGAARLYGVCPHVLADFLHVRGIGILNIRRQYGLSALSPCHGLDLLIELTESKQFEPQRLTPLQSCRTMGGIEMTQFHLAVKPGRNLAILVEALVGLSQLQQTGYSASADFINRQQQLIEQQLA